MGAAWYKSLFCLQVSLFAILSDCKSPLYYRIQYFSFSKVYHDHVGSYLDSSLLTSSSGALGEVCDLLKHANGFQFEAKSIPI